MMKTADARKSLPPNRAFVVQLHGSMDSSWPSGRVEHVASGEKARFGSLEELWAFVNAILVRGSVASGARATRQPAAPSEEDKFRTPGGPQRSHAAPTGANPQRRER